MTRAGSEDGEDSANFRDRAAEGGTAVADKGYEESRDGDLQSRTGDCSWAFPH